MPSRVWRSRTSGSAIRVSPAGGYRPAWHRRACQGRGSLKETTGRAGWTCATLAAALLALLAVASELRAQPRDGEPVIDIWYGTYQVFGGVGLPQRWVNILGTVSDPDGIDELTYSLNDGPGISLRPKYDTANDLSIGPDGRRLAEPGDFNVELDTADLSDGLNQIVLTATDTTTATSQVTVTVDYSAGNYWPESHTIDWGTTTDIQDVVQVVDGQWMITSDGLRPVVMGYDRVVALGDMAWDDYEVTVPFTLHDIDSNGFSPLSGSPGFGLTFRWTGHVEGPDDPDAQPRYYWWPAGGGVWYDAGYNGPLSIGTWEGNLEEIDTSGLQLAYDTPYVFKFRVETVLGVGSRYSIRVWEQGQPEPGAWILSGIEAAVDEPYGSCIIVAHHVDLTIGDITVAPLADPNPPVIGDIRVVPTDTNATITWTTNEPATSAVGYGPTSAYEDGTVYGPSPVLSHSVILSPLTTGQLYHFQITSVDVDLNETTSADSTFVANVDTNGPVISDIQAFAGSTSTTIAWTTDEPATGVADYGFTEIYTGAQSDYTLGTDRLLHIGGLDPETLYHYEISAEDMVANVTTSGDLTFTTGADAPLVYDGFNVYSPGDDPADWFDTEADNSLVVNNALFEVFDVGAETVFGTASVGANVHSHYVDAGSDTWSSLVFTGRMKVAHADGGVGVTFWSDYPDSIAYYRLRRHQWDEEFHLAPYGTSITSGTTHTGVVAWPGVWYHFVIVVENQDSLSRTAVRVKIWPEGDVEPSTWQADGFDESPGRLTSGTIGVWSMGPGNKYWDDLEVIALGNDCADGDPCTIDVRTNAVCVHEPVDCSAFDDPCNEASCDPLGEDGNCDILAPDDVGSSCSDGEFCNGAETCDSNGMCQPGTPPGCADTVGCTVDYCDEVNDECVNAPSNGLCDNGNWCDGTEICDALLDCQAGSDPCLGSQWCDDNADTCVEYGDGDFEPDGDVDLADFRAFQECFGQFGLGVCQPGNLTGDGTVDLNDYLLFSQSLEASGP